MSYTTYFLRFASKEEAETKLTEVGYSQEVNVPMRETETQTVFRVPDGDIDIIGDLYNNDGVYETGEDGFPIEVTPPTKMEGYHLNIIKKGELAEDLQEFLVTPSSPRRVFA
jgi:hypothetical protein